MKYFFLTRYVSARHLLIYLILFLSCKQTNIQPILGNLNAVKSNVNSKDKKNYTDLREFSQQIGLDNLDSGYQYEQIRIWVNTSRRDSSKIVVFTYKFGKWYGEGYNFKELFDDSIRMIGVSKSKKEIFPKGGWAKFEKRFSDLHFNSLREPKEIPTYNTHFANHCGEIIIEVAGTSFHQILKYPCFEFYKNDVEEVKVILTFLKYIQSDFGFDLGKDF